MQTRNKILASALVVGVLGGLAALGVFGAFSATTQNSGNEITTGTVALTDNDNGQAMFNVTDAKPGDTWSRCIKVTYSGSLPAEVRAYLQSTPGVLSPYLTAKIEKGSQASSTFPSCTGFTDEVTELDKPLTDPAFPRDWAGGVVSDPLNKTQWDQGDTSVFRVTLSVSNAMPNSLQNQTTGPAAVVWEARDHSGI
jgi:hypothetical protein